MCGVLKLESCEFVFTQRCVSNTACAAANDKEDQIRQEVQEVKNFLLWQEK